MIRKKGRKREIITYEREFGEPRPLREIASVSEDTEFRVAFEDRSVDVWFPAVFHGEEPVFSIDNPYSRESKRRLSQPVLKERFQEDALRPKVQVFAHIGCLLDNWEEWVLSQMNSEGRTGTPSLPYK
mmetsp:Transcript_38550/g.43779  ORF Transcript_38550/g.43779 Transcript_38550/m.43779 type:complete len:128 (+) Transcript_38550:27-410(+)